MYAKTLATNMAQNNQTNASNTNLSATAEILSQNREILNNEGRYYTQPQDRKSDHTCITQTSTLFEKYPQSISTILQELDTKWAKIEKHLESQNKCWENVETQLNNQNSRMSNIEQQMFQLQDIKKSLNINQTNVARLDADVSNMRLKINEYDTSIQNYSDICDSVVRTSAESNAKLDAVLKRVVQIELNQLNIQENYDNNANRLIDLQWRSMRQNLIFTGINELYLPRGQYENAEETLVHFLRTEMHINFDIKFDRVHRLGRFKRNQTYPRPIVARFESYKDKEYIRLAAPKTLAGKRYSVREQFPPEIEEKRKFLYPIAKQARQNKNNTVKLVRDKLYVNGQEIDVENVPPNDSAIFGGNGRQSYGSNTHQYRQVPHRQQNIHQIPVLTTSQRNHYQPNRNIPQRPLHQPGYGQRGFVSQNSYVTPRNEHFKSRNYRDTPNAWEIPIQNQFQVLCEIAEDDNEASIPPQHGPTKDSNKNVTTTTVNPAMPGKRQNVNTHNRKVETAGTRLPNSNSSLVRNKHSVQQENSAQIIASFSECAKASSSAQGPYPGTDTREEINTNVSNFATTASYTTSDACVPYATASVVASANHGVIEAVLLQDGYNHGTSQNLNDSDTTLKEAIVSNEQQIENVVESANSSWEFNDEFWTDGNNSRDAGISQSSAMSNASSYIDTGTHLYEQRAGNFQMSNVVDSTMYHDPAVLTTNTNQDLSDTVYIPPGSTYARQSDSVNI